MSHLPFFTETKLNQKIPATIFGYKTHSPITQIIKKWILHWGHVGLDLSVLPFIDSDFLDNTKLIEYKNLKLEKVGAIIDEKDFLTETCRKIEL